MFTLCMSRGANKQLQDSTPQHTTTSCGKQVKGGYLLRYKRGWLVCGWCEEWVVLYEDSTVAWFADKGCGAPRGRVRLRDAPELLAAGEWTRRVPRGPPHCRPQQLLALGAAGPKRPHVHWLMAQSAAEVNDWMAAISNTLPPPPRDKGCSVAVVAERREPRYSPAGVEHTVPAAVLADWGRGWGWGWGEPACLQLAPGSDALYCADDYSLGGYDDVMDYSACADFSF